MNVREKIIDALKLEAVLFPEKEEEILFLLKRL
jgi:hypothetical protein